MTLEVLGSVGFGLVWGWLVARIDAVRPISARGIVAIGASSLTVVGLVASSAQWPAPAAFLAASVLALLMHLGWLQELRHRGGASV